MCMVIHVYVERLTCSNHSCMSWSPLHGIKETLKRAWLKENNLCDILQVPELEEAFSIRLLNATGGATVTTSGSQVATITVQASDHPYGLFTFSSAFRPLEVSEDVGMVELMVTREFGDVGSVTVDYTTVESGHSSLRGLIDVTRLEDNRYKLFGY